MAGSGRKPRGGTAASLDLAAIRQAARSATRAAHDPRLGTTLGGLRTARQLTECQFAAAEAYGRLRGRHDRMMGLPSRSARSVLLDEHTGRSAAEMGRRAVMALRDDHARLLAHVGPGKAMLDRIILDDESPRSGELPRLRSALDSLAEWLDHDVA